MGHIVASVQPICMEHSKARIGHGSFVRCVSLKILFQNLWMKAHVRFLGVWLPSKMAPLTRQIPKFQLPNTFSLGKKPEEYIFHPRLSAIWTWTDKYN